MTQASNVGIEEGHCVQELEAGARELLRDFTEEGLGIASLQSCKKDQRAKVRTHFEQVGRRELACHHGMTSAGFSRGIEQLAKLANPQPMDLVRDGTCGFRRFALEGGDGNLFHSGRPRRFNQEGGVAASSSDEKKGFRYRQQTLFTRADWR